MEQVWEHSQRRQSISDTRNRWIRTFQQQRNSFVHRSTIVVRDVVTEPDPQLRMDDDGAPVPDR